LILEIASLLIINTSQIKETVDVNNYNPSSYISFTAGDSQFQLEERERVAREEAEEASRIYKVLQRRTIAREKAERAVRSSTSGTNPYIYGFCTWWVAEEKGITQIWGDAKYWPVNSSIPTAGAIIVTYENRYYGHVGIIREINGTQVKIEEMNYVGWNRVSTRIVDYRTLPVKGFLII
jgi:surface antigen